MQPIAALTAWAPEGHWIHDPLKVHIHTPTTPLSDHDLKRFVTCCQGADFIAVDFERGKISTPGVHPTAIAMTQVAIRSQVWLFAHRPLEANYAEENLVLPLVPELMNVLTDPAILKVGVGTEQDVVELQRALKVVMTPVVDIQLAYRSKKSTVLETGKVVETEEKPSLFALVGILMGRAIHTKGDVATQTSVPKLQDRWLDRSVDLNQYVDYAQTDAVLPYVLYEYFKKKCEDEGRIGIRRWEISQADFESSAIKNPFQFREAREKYAAAFPGKVFDDTKTFGQHFTDVNTEMQRLWVGNRDALTQQLGAAVGGRNLRPPSGGKMLTETGLTFDNSCYNVQMTSERVNGVQEAPIWSAWSGECVYVEVARFLSWYMLYGKVDAGVADLIRLGREEAPLKRANRC